MRVVALACIAKTVTVTARALLSESHRGDTARMHNQILNNLIHIYHVYRRYYITWRPSGLADNQIRRVLK